MQLAKEERDKRLKEEELTRMKERGTLQQKTEDEAQEEEEDLPDDITEEGIYRARLKKLTAEKNLYNFKSLAQEDRDILAYNKGADLLDKPEKKKKKKKKMKEYDFWLPS